MSENYWHSEADVVNNGISQSDTFELWCDAERLLHYKFIAESAFNIWPTFGQEDEEDCFNTYFTV